MLRQPHSERNRRLRLEQLEYRLAMATALEALLASEAPADSQAESGMMGALFQSLDPWIELGAPAATTSRGGAVRDAAPELHALASGTLVLAIPAQSLSARQANPEAATTDAAVSASHNALGNSRSAALATVVTSGPAANRFTSPAEEPSEGESHDSAPRLRITPRSQPPASPPTNSPLPSNHVSLAPEPHDSTVASPNIREAAADAAAEQLGLSEFDFAGPSLRDARHTASERSVGPRSRVPNGAEQPPRASGDAPPAADGAVEFQVTGNNAAEVDPLGLDVLALAVRSPFASLDAPDNELASTVGSISVMLSAQDSGDAYVDGPLLGVSIGQPWDRLNRPWTAQQDASMRGALDLLSEDAASLWQNWRSRATTLVMWRAAPASAIVVTIGVWLSRKRQAPSLPASEDRWSDDTLVRPQE